MIDANYIFRLEAAVLDLVADDSGGLQKQKQVYHWDKVIQCWLLAFYFYFLIFVIFLTNILAYLVAEG